MSTAEARESFSSPKVTIGLGLPMTSLAFSQPPLHIPNSKGEVYKTELVIERTDERVVKINWWFLPDDDDHRASPHNHPWRFTSEVLHGELTEVRYTPVYEAYDPDGNGVGEIERYHIETLTHRAGEIYECPADTFHVVVAVAPGTVTRMTCGAVVNLTWGYLDTKTYLFASATKDPSFLGRLWTVNPFKRPKA